MSRKRKSRRKNALPKGAYRLPTGGYVQVSSHNGYRIKGVRRDQPDLQKIALALRELVEKQQREQLNDQTDDDPAAAAEPPQP